MTNIAMCNLCGNRRGKRICPRLDGVSLCSLCCGQSRSWQACPIDCRFFPEDPGPAVTIGNVSFGPVVQGDKWTFQERLYIPNLFAHIFCQVEFSRISFTSPQEARLQVGFHLKRNFGTEPGLLDAKDGWRSQHYPEDTQGRKLFPIVGVVSVGRGLLVPGSVNLQPPLANAIVSGHWIVVAPHGRPLIDPDSIARGRPPRPVSLLQIRNQMLFSELIFERPYRLEACVLNGSEFLDDGILGCRLGILLPFGRVQVAPPLVTPPSDFTAESMLVGMLSTIEVPVYPGESPDGCSTTFIPCRGNEGVVAANVSAEVETLGRDDLVGVLSPGPCAAVVAAKLRTKQELVVALLQHDTSVNAKLLPVLRRQIGNMASPLHLSVFNMTDSSRRIDVRETNQRTGISRSETPAIDAHGEAIVPLLLPGIDAEPPGDLPLLVEVVSGAEVVFTESLSIRLLPPDSLLLRVEDPSRDWYRNTLDAVACWVTPDEDAVADWIAGARARAGISMGASSATPIDEQIAALWDDLKAMGTGFQSRAYVADVSACRSYQRVTVPRETLRLASGNCLDYTVLFSSALERLGFRPVVVLQPGHAFLAWEAADGTPDGGLETTLLGSSTAVDGLARGRQRLRQVQERLDQQPDYRAVRIREAREAGWSPIF